MQDYYGMNYLADKVKKNEILSYQRRIQGLVQEGGGGSRIWEVFLPFLDPIQK